MGLTVSEAVRLLLTKAASIEALFADLSADD